MENERVSQAGGAAGVRALEGMRPLILASSSPRRSEILTAVGWPFEAQAAHIDETRRDAEAPEDFVSRLAREKAERVASTRLFGLVLGADTTVVVDGHVLEKPRDAEDARRMLRLMSERWHEVLTGVALLSAESGRAATGLGRAALFIEAIDGDYWNVVGLPVRLVYELARGLDERMKAEG